MRVGVLALWSRGRAGSRAGVQGKQRLAVFPVRRWALLEHMITVCVCGGTISGKVALITVTVNRAHSNVAD